MFWVWGNSESPTQFSIFVNVNMNRYYQDERRVMEFESHLFQSIAKISFLFLGGWSGNAQIKPNWVRAGQ